MQRAIHLPPLSNGSVYVSQAAGFCAFGLIAPSFYHRSQHDLSVIDGAVIGAFLGQFLWSVAWCALGPGRWIGRYLIVVAAATAIAGAVLVGIALKPETERERSMGHWGRRVAQGPTARERSQNQVLGLGRALPLSLLVCQLPLLWNRSYRGWRILFRAAPPQSPETELLMFGLADLFGGTAGTAIALAAWRLQTWESSTIPAAAEAALGTGLVCVLCLVIGSLALPLVPFVLADRSRRPALASVAIYAGGIAMVLATVLTWLSRPGRSLEMSIAIFAYFAAIASAMLAVFWLGRELGYRLLRTRRRGLFGSWRVPQWAWRALAKASVVRAILARMTRFSEACRFPSALLRWSAVSLAVIAGACILFWVISLSTAKADLGFVFRIEDEITISGGTFTISAIVSSRGDWRAWQTPAKPRRWMVPGMQIERIEDYGGRTWLTVEFSLLVPGLAAAILAAILIHRYKLATKGRRDSADHTHAIRGGNSGG